MKAFPWRAGMRTLATADEPARIIYAVLGTYPMGIRVGDTRVRPDVSAIRHDAQPDPNDGATKGALLEAVREAWRPPQAHVIWSPDKGRTHDPEQPWRAGSDNDPALIARLNQYAWMVKGPGQTDAWLTDIERRVSPETYDRVLRDILGHSSTEFAALLAAWEAAP